MLKKKKGSEDYRKKNPQDFPLRSAIVSYNRLGRIFLQIILYCVVPHLAILILNSRAWQDLYKI